MKISLSSSILAFVLTFSNYNAGAQQAGNKEIEGNPTITLKECTLAGGCTSTKAKVTLDANWRHIHKVGEWTNCYTGNAWDTGICTDPHTCAQNCAVEQVSSEKYKNTYGIEQLDNGVKLNFVTNHQHGTNVGSRLYVMDGDDKYKMFYLKNREFAVDIDVSQLECGTNGALYFVEMDEYGGKGLGNNQAGAKYGTGYCDAQCPHDIKFIDGEANVIDWKPNDKDFAKNMGMGKYGSCCAEMDIWEANSMATAYTPHPCDLGGDFSKAAQYKCEGIDCGDTDKGERYQGVCDKDGCDINPFRMGNQNFYGRGDNFAVNTLKPMTVVTQFLTVDGTDTGDLSEIRRFYVQDGNIIHSPTSTILGSDDADSITDGFCEAKKDLFGDINDFQMKGGNANMGDSLDRGQVLALSLWDDVEVNMLWLDSAYPLDKPINDPGIKRGECPGGVSSTPQYVRSNFPNSYVTFQNAAIGEIGSTLQKSPTAAPTRGPCGLCEPAPGKNQPECNGNTETRCKTMMQYENKCNWTECAPTPSPTPRLRAPTSSPTKKTDSPTNSPTDKSPCCSCNYRDCRAGWCSESEDNCVICGDIWLTSGAQTGCIDQWNECTNDINGCCDGLVCAGNSTFKQCVAPGDTSAPTGAPTSKDTFAPTGAPTIKCVDDESYTFIWSGKVRDCAWIKKKVDNGITRHCGKPDPDNGNQLIGTMCPKACNNCTL